ncbi:VOC family protein [Oceaniglobus roseus]|uniref:VOC family protein n=1 Tax=Oceaniglobus roseus TaxID=1737570 RepID=UPI000C7EFB8F|nr:VOC family protein [Kandeliimicrobium roseum]
MLMGLHHVQLAMPEGGEAEARAFYGEVLGMFEVARPEGLKARGGCWFEQGSVRVHLGVQSPFQPATKAHPAFQVASLGVATDRLRRHGVAVGEVEELPEIRRIHIDDPFGNRIEILERRD